MTAHVDRQTCLVCGRARSRAELDGCLRACGSCGFRWTAEPGGAAETTDLFEGSRYGDYFARADQWRYEARRRLRWLLATARPTSLLEAGPAGGFFLEAARRDGIDVDGLEVSTQCVRFAQTRLGLPVRHGCFEKSIPHTQVEAICAFHVLEHVDDPHRFLAVARAALVPGGWLALEVPNIDSAQARRQGRSWPALQPDVHHWHFSPTTLVRLVSHHGFQVRHCNTVATTYYTRPHQLLNPWGAFAAIRERASTHTLRARHPSRGALLRLIAQLPATVCAQ